MTIFKQLLKNNLFNVFKIGGSVAMLFFLLWKIDIHQLMQSVQHAELSTLMFAISITLLSMYLRWEKWDTLVGREKNIMKRKTIYMYLVGLFFSSITPAKIGDMIRVKYLQHEGVSFSRSLLLSVFDRLFDLIAICVYAVFVIVFFQHVLLISVVAILFLLFIIAFFQHDYLYVFFLQYNTVVPEKFLRSKYVSFFRTRRLKEALSSILFPKIWMYFLLLSLAIWFSLGIQTQLLLASFSIILPIWKIVTVICAGAITGLIPFSFSGYGFREGMIAYLFTQLGVEYEIGLTVAFLYTFFSFLLPAFVSGVIYASVESQQKNKNVF